MANVADTYMIYQVLKRLTTPFDETKAFELGLIDKNGKLLKKAKTSEEKKAYTYFDRFIFNMKRLLHKFGLKSKFASYGAALFLLKEDRDGYMPTDQEMLKGVLENEKYLRENYNKNLAMLREDAPANATGAAVAGTGSDPVHWGKRPGLKGNRKKVGRSISALNFIKQRNKLMANTHVKSSYPAGAFKVEENNPRIARKSGQPAKSDKHSDLYTDEDPKGTIHGLKFATVQDAKDSVSKIKNSGRSHAHKIQAAVAMEQRAIAAKKRGAAAIYRIFINKMKKKTKEKNEDYTHYPVQVDPKKDKSDGWITGDPPLPIKVSGDADNFLDKANKQIERERQVVQKPYVESLYANIHKKRREGRPMRKKGAKGAPKPSDFDRAAQTAREEAPVIGGIKMKKLGKSKPGGYKSLVTRHLGAKAAEKIDKSDGSKLVAKGKKTGNTDLIRKGNFIKNVIGRK